MRKHLQSFIGLCLIGIIALTALGVVRQPAQAAPDTQTGVGFIRFANATVTGGDVNVYLDNRLIANKLFNVVGYFTFYTGDHTVVFTTPAGDQIASANFTLANVTRMTAALIGAGGDSRVVVTVDNAAPPVRNLSRVAYVNAVQGSDGQDVRANGEVVASDIGFGDVTEATEVVAGSYSVALGSAAASDIVLSPGRYYLVFFVGDSASPTPRIVQLTGRPYRVSGTNRFRFMNLVDVPEGTDEATYDVYVNADPIAVYAGIQYGEATNEVVVTPGTYNFEVYATGTSPDGGTPVATLDTEIAEDQSLFIILTGTPDAVKVDLFADDLTPVPVNTARLQVMNLTSLIPTFGVVSQNGITLVQEVSEGSLASANIPGGLYDLTLVDASDPSASVGRAEVNAPSGSIATLIIYGADRQRWTWFNETVEQVASVRFAHAAPDSPSLDFYLNGDLVLNNLNYLDYTDYLTLPAGNYELTVYPGDVTPAEGVEPMWRDQLTIAANNFPLTFVALGTDNFRVNGFADNLEIIPPDQARVRFIHAVRNVPGMSVINAASGDVLAGVLAYGQGSDNLNMNANTRTFNFSDGQGNVYYRIESFDLTKGNYYTFIVVGDLSDPTTLGYILIQVQP
ncbi:MAG: DUF4397 domain-containing protein [Chloroflexi bacterium]|nr:DUF4397 domain-containing protein [Chloroflexota bacterium]